MRHESRLPTRTPESRDFAARTRVAMRLSAELNALPFDDVENRTRLLEGLLGQVPADLTILPPFHSDYGLHAQFGDKVFINQGCWFLDFGGITIGDRALIGPNVTLSTTGHPVHPDERFEAITHAPITIEDDVWIGASATIAPGVSIGRGSVIGAGAVVAKDVAPMTVVTASSSVVRRRLDYVV